MQERLRILGSGPLLFLEFRRIEPTPSRRPCSRCSASRFSAPPCENLPLLRSALARPLRMGKIPPAACWFWGSRPPATRPRPPWSRTGGGCGRTWWPRRCWCTRSSAAWCPRWPRGSTWRRWCRCCGGRSPTRASTFADLDGLAVTCGPGLVGALLVGVEVAKALGYALGKPVVGVNHLAGHLAAAFIEHAGHIRVGACRAARRAAVPAPGAAGVGRAHDAAALREPGARSRCWARPATTPPARPSTRWPSCWGWATRAAW